MTKRRPGKPLRPNVVLDGFTDLVEIGSGGFSAVYSAREPKFDRRVAVKVLDAGFADDRERRAFERECRMLGQLDHPYVVTVYQSTVTADNRPCIVMQLYERNFRDYLTEIGTVPAQELLDVGIRMAVALHVAHRAGVLHRDVKPHNIFRTAYGDAALGDFGIATLDTEHTLDRGSALSIAYAAPEILEDRPATVASDVYSLAATLHHLATGHAPYQSADLTGAIKRILHDDPPPIDRADLPASFERVLRNAMSKDSAARPFDARAFAEMLREVQARAAHPPTPLKLGGAEPAEPAAIPVERAPSPVVPAPLATPGFDPPHVTDSATPAAAVVGPADYEATVVRNRPAPPAAPVAPSGPDRRRRWLAAGAALLVVAAVAVGVVVATRGTGSSTTTTVSTEFPTIPPDTFFDVIDPPDRVTISSIEGGRFLVTVSFVTEASSYEVERVGGTGDMEIAYIQAPDASVAVDGLGASNLCVVVRAVSAAGRVSRDAGPFCSG